MKKNFLVAFISILIISTMAYATSYIIHDYDTGIMHMAQDIYLTNTNSVQTQIDSIETSLNGNYVLKSGSITQIATRNHDDLQNITGNGTVHLSASEKLNYDTAYSHSQNTTSAHGLTISDVALKSGSLSQFTTRNASDINVTATSYSKGLAATDVNLQKVSDRVNQNGTPQFVTDKTKCSLLLDFKGTLADRSRAINPIGSDAANKWVDGYVNDSTTKTSATNISCTLKQFEGDEGKFGSGIAVEESRTNLLLQSEDLTSATWTKNNCTATLDRILPDGRKLFKITINTTADASITQPITFGNQAYSFQAFMQYTGKTYSWSLYNADIGAVLFVNKINDTANALTKITGTNTPSAAKTGVIQMYIANPTAGDTFYITSPQLEVGAFPTSYIATGATAVKRPVSMLTYEKPDMLNSSNYSLSFWVKHNFAWDESVSFAHGLFGFGSSPTHTIYYDARYNIYQIDFGSGLNGYSVLAPNFNDWKHFTITQSGTIGKVYINNVKILEVSNATPIDFSSLTLGKYGVFPANSNISNFAIFNYALTADEISQIYNSGLEGKPIAITNPENIIPVGQSLHDPNFITFASGWGISSTYPNKPTLSKSSNVALMRGILEYSGVVNSDVTIFTLPIGARPSLPDTYYHSFVATARDSGAPAMRILRVYGNGDVKLMANGATITNPTISLDNINYVNGK